MFRKLALTLAIFVCGTALCQTAPTLDEILSRNTAARGGLDKIKAIQTEKATGTALMMNRIEAPLTLYFKRPNLMRMDINYQGRQIVQAFDGTHSWEINPMTGSDEPQGMPEAEAKRHRDLSSPIDGLQLDYKARGMTAELAGQEDVEGSPAYKIKFTSKDGDIVYVYIDVGTYLDVKDVAKVSQGGQEMEIESLLGAYKPEGGVMMPHSIEQKVNGQTVLKMVLEKIEINPPIDDAIFEFPVK